VRKNTLSPDWNEALELDWVSSEEGVAALGPLVIRMLDHDVGSESDLVGAVKLDALSVFKRRVGEECEVVVELLDKKGVPVQGKDGKTSELLVKLRIDRMIAEPPASGADDANGRRLIVNVLSARSLPKMDMLGLCDPFVELTFKENVCKTGVRKNTLTPEWNEKLELPWVASPDDTLTALVVCVYDYDTVSSNDFVGEATIEQAQVSALLARPLGPAGEPVTVKLFDKNSAPVIGKDKKQAEVRLSIAVEGCADWQAPQGQASTEPAEDAGNHPAEKQFPSGEGRRLGYAVDSQAKHANWTKKNEIIVNSDKEKEARLRALAAAQARSINASGAMEDDRQRQETLAKAALRRFAEQGTRGTKKDDDNSKSMHENQRRGAQNAGISRDKDMQRDDVPKERGLPNNGDTVSGTDLEQILGAARRVLSEDFTRQSKQDGAYAYEEREPYPKLQTLHNDNDDDYLDRAKGYPTLSAMADDPWSHTKQSSSAVMRSSHHDFARGHDDASGDGQSEEDEVLLRARALLAVAGALRPPVATAERRDYGADERNGTNGNNAQQRDGYGVEPRDSYAMVQRDGAPQRRLDDGGDEMAVLSRIRDVVRGLAGGGQAAAQQHDRQLAVTSHHDYRDSEGYGKKAADFDRYRDEAGSFSSDGYAAQDTARGENVGAFSAPIGKIGGVLHNPQPMPFGDATSTVTLPSVDGSVAGDSVFDGGKIEMGGRVRGEGDEVRVCISDMKTRGLGPAGEGVKFFLKLQLQGFKAKTTQVRGL
jgi:hypothetical protein